MRRDRNWIGVVAFAALVGCGGSLTGAGGTGTAGATGTGTGTAGSTSTGSGGGGPPPPAACATLGACDCFAASDRCTPRTDPCWCPSECDPQIACICGGGQFLGCDEKNPDTCDIQLSRVQTLCAGQPFIGDIGGLCQQNPTCIAGCLAQLQTADTCSQIDCSFCLACDCAGPVTASAFRACVNTCTTLR